MKYTVASLALCALCFQPVQGAPPVVSAITASQRPGTKLVDIYYNVSDADGDAQNIQVQVSGDGGLTYTIPCITLSGHVGSGITPGTAKHIVWNAGVDWNGQFVANTKVRITAYDGTTPPPPPGMVYIAAGSFQMGDSLGDGGANELPVHNVYLDAYFIDRHEASKELWQSVQSWGASNGYSINFGTSRANGHPICNVSWYDCAKWCNARSQKDGLTPCYYTDSAHTLVYKAGTINIDNTMVKWNANGYRLPTEAEWEKAARGAMLGQRYPWGDTINGSNANYLGSGDPSEGIGSPKTTLIGYYNGSQIPSGLDMANGFGLYDMSGNILEWCWDWYSASYYGEASSANNPWGPSSGTLRVLRGGSYDSTISGLRCSIRYVSSATGAGLNFGFRCVKKQ